MSLIDKQIDREERAVSRGIERFYDTLDADRAKGREFEGPVGQTMIRKAMDEFIPVINLQLREARRNVVGAQTKGERLAGWELPMLSLKPEEMAYITIKTALTNEQLLVLFRTRRWE